jgi:hypothetical protein
MQLDQRRAQLVQQKEDLEASLASQRNVSAQLRDEVAKLTAKLQQVTDYPLSCVSVWPALDTWHHTAE